MKLYRISQEYKQPELFSQFEDELRLEEFSDKNEFIDECYYKYDPRSFLAILRKNGVETEKITFPGGQVIDLIEGDDKKFVVEKETIYEASDWVFRKDLWDLQSYYPEDEREEFWNNVYNGLYTYHATPDENVEDIQINGLEARDESRGLANRGTGEAVFTSENMYEIESYGNNIFRIDLGMMKADGYMPEVEKETPVEEYALVEAMAHKLDIQISHDIEQGISDNTLVIFGDIPAKYLKLMEK